MGLLKEIVLVPGIRPQVIQDCCVLIDQEVASKSGLSGLAIKAGYAVFKAVKKTALPDAVEFLLDDFITVLDQQHERYIAEQTPVPGGFRTHLMQHRREVAEGLLTITDARQQSSTNKTVKAAYLKLRPSASQYVQDAVPRVGELMERYLAGPRPTRA